MNCDEAKTLAEQALAVYDKVTSMLDREEAIEQKKEDEREREEWEREQEREEWEREQDALLDADDEYDDDEYDDDEYDDEYDDGYEDEDELLRQLRSYKPDARTRAIHKLAKATDLRPMMELYFYYVWGLVETSALKQLPSDLKGRLYLSEARLINDYLMALPLVDSEAVITRVCELDEERELNEMSISDIVVQPWNDCINNWGILGNDEVNRLAELHCNFYCA